MASLLKQFIDLFINGVYVFFFVQQTLMSEPEEIATMKGQKIPRKCSIGKLHHLKSCSGI